MNQSLIALASDHGGFELKSNLVHYFTEQKFDVLDLGTHDSQSVDYPDYAKKVALGIQNKEFEKAILVCGTGVGISIAANKFLGIRASVITDPYTAKMARAHNDLNVLCLGGRLIAFDYALEIVKNFLYTPFEGDRHQRRLDKIAQFEKSSNE